MLSDSYQNFLHSFYFRSHRSNMRAQRIREILSAQFDYFKMRCAHDQLKMKHTAQVGRFSTKKRLIHCPPLDLYKGERQ